MYQKTTIHTYLLLINIYINKHTMLPINYKNTRVFLEGLIQDVSFVIYFKNTYM